MTQISKWDAPNNFHVVFRCTTSEYADAFIEKGSIKFGTPESWVKAAEEKGEGRGDRLEGTIAFYRNDVKEMKDLNEQYKHERDLIRMPYGEKIYLKRKKVIELPCFCFYILKNEMFKCPDEEGTHELEAEISGKYFKDFMDNMDPEEVEKLEDKDKPAIIVISDYNTFQERLMEALLRLGLCREEILREMICYKDFKEDKYGWMDFDVSRPIELTVKRKKFAYQNEARIIVNTTNEKIKSRLRECPIELGAMNDIAEIHKGYLYKGMTARVNVEVTRKHSNDT